MVVVVVVVVVCVSELKSGYDYALLICQPSLSETLHHHAYANLSCRCV
jgi:hypothetical protein